MAIRRQRAPRPGEILAFVSGVRGSSYRAEDGKSGPQVRISPAPCCANRKRGGSATVNTATGLWTCFACGSKGNWYGLTRAYGRPLADPYQDAPKVDFAVYDQIRARLRRPVSAGHHPALVAACLARGLTGATLDAWRVTSCGPNAIRVPLFALDHLGGWRLANARIRQVVDRAKADAEGRPADWFEVKGGPTSLAMGNHLLGRDPRPERENKPFWLRDWLDPSREAPEPGAATASPFPAVKRVLIFEGQWDAMSAWQLGIPNVLSMPNGASSVDVSGLLRYVPDDAEVWLGVDMDEAGNRAAELFFAQLGTKLKRLQLPFKDLNEWLMERPSLTAEEVLDTARIDNSPGVRATVDMEGDFVDDRPAEIVCQTPWPRLTRRLDGGWRECQTSGILAPSGHGKTTIVNNIVAEAVKFVKVGIIQLETTTADNVKKLKAQIVGWNRPDEPEDLKPLLKRVLMSSLIGKEVKWQETIDEARDLMVQGAKLVVVDNWDYICKMDEKARAYSALQGLCKHYRAHGIVVWQPAKVDRDEKVNSGSQKGYSTFLQDADVYITLNKYGLARRLEVEKARVEETDEDSSVIWLSFDRDRQCLFETEARGDLKPVQWTKFSPPEEDQDDPKL